MSVQFRRWNCDGSPPASDYMDRARAVLAAYGPDSDETYSNGGTKMFYGAFHTTRESRRETQPHLCPCGAVLTWDGRLDNRADLIRELRDSLTICSTDIEVVAAVFERWGIKGFARLIGDWALSIWNPTNHSLILAKDPIGTRQLYYSVEKDYVTWSTLLDPLVLYARRTFEICEEYLAGWLSYLPAVHLTPYIGIYAVPPSASVLLQPIKHGVKHVVSKYWDFDPGKRVRYSTDAEYEEHFRTVFAQAVRRRLRSDRPVLAELSGGMDSSSIVCIADTVIAHDCTETSRLDTISWHDDSYDEVEPNWNERPYFTKVEEKRGRTGCHINLGALKRSEKRDLRSQESLIFKFHSDRLGMIPDFSSPHHELCKQYAAYRRSHGYRITLSGIGGDEVTGGGVPTPIPELRNLLARARFGALTHQVSTWAAKMRKPRLPLVWEAIRGFLMPAFAGLGAPADLRAAPWFDTGFVRRNHLAFSGYPSRLRLFGPLPSFQENMATLEVLRRTVAAPGPPSDLPWERRFPYLDRDMLEFMYAIPREQIVRVGRRRSLMKRALIGIVPDELLNRRRTAVAPQESDRPISIEWPSTSEIGEHLVGSYTGLMDAIRFLETLQRARRNEEVAIDMLVRTIKLEFWLRHVTNRGIVAASMSRKRSQSSFSLDAKKLPSARPFNSSAS